MHEKKAVINNIAIQYHTRFDAITAEKRMSELEAEFLNDEMAIIDKSSLLKAQLNDDAIKTVVKSLCENKKTTSQDMKKMDRRKRNRDAIFTMESFRVG